MTWSRMPVQNPSGMSKPKQSKLGWSKIRIRRSSNPSTAMQKDTPAALTTDTGASVSIHVSEFFTLAAKALASEPVAAGQYGETRVVTVAGEPSEEGWKDLADFIVVNGTIVFANYNAIYSKEYVADGDNSNAKYFSVDGDKATALSKDQLKEAYGMTAAGQRAGMVSAGGTA